MSTVPETDPGQTDRLPLPLARLHRRALNAKQPLDRHQAAYYFWEASLKLAGTVLLCEQARLRRNDPKTTANLPPLDRPSIGHWWNLTRTLLPLLAERKKGAYSTASEVLLGSPLSHVPRVTSLCVTLSEILEGKGGSRSSVRVKDVFELLVRYRNQELGHGASGQKSAIHYDRVGKNLLHGTSELLSVFDPLFGHDLLYVDDVRRTSGDGFAVDGLVLRGESPKRIEPLEIRSAESHLLPHPGRIHLLCPATPSAPASLGTSLHPLLTFDEESGEALFHNGIKRSGPEYLSYSTGRVVTREDLRADHTSFLESLTGEKPAPEPPPVPREDEAPAPKATSSSTIGDFELRSRLGRGGMGLVYRAYQPSLDRDVAVKCLLNLGDLPAQARFAREMKALGRIDHENVVRIFASGIDGEQWFYAMEVVEGADLASLLRELRRHPSPSIGMTEWKEALDRAVATTRSREVPLEAGPSGPSGLPGFLDSVPGEPPAPDAGGKTLTSEVIREITCLGLQAVRGLEALHSAGILHRDLKPANVMITADGSRAVLMDLGLAHFEEEGADLTRSGQFVGTLRYASPEQVLSSRATGPPGDIYSMGATLWELVTLRPFLDITGDLPTPELLRRVQHKVAESPRSLAPAVPRDLDALLLRCLEKDPARRYESASQLATDLERQIRGERVSALSGATTATLRRGMARRKKAIAAVIVVLSLIPLTYLVAKGMGLGKETTFGDIPTSPSREDVVPGALLASAEFRYANTPSHPGRLITDADTVKNGSSLCLRLHADRPVHVYVWNVTEDRISYASFPLVDCDLQNPVDARDTILLPGTFAGSPRAWQLDDMPGFQLYHVVASVNPIPELERLLSQMNQPTYVEGTVASRPVEARQLTAQLRGAAGLAPIERKEPMEKWGKVTTFNDGVARFTLRFRQVP